MSRIILKKWSYSNSWNCTSMWTHLISINEGKLFFSSLEYLCRPKVELNEHFSVLDNVYPHQELTFLDECRWTQKRPRHTLLHCTGVTLGVRGIPAFKAGLRSDGAEKEQLEGCWHVEKEEKKIPMATERGNPAQILPSPKEDPLMLNHTETEMMLSCACK